MKKEYISPRALVVELNTQPLLNAMSPTSEKPGTNPNPDDPYQGEFSAPGYDNWDDEEEW